jgi:predicted nucleotidyltransferase
MLECQPDQKSQMFPRFQESLQMDKLEKALKCLKRYEPEKIILFGSCARGDMDESSDLDFVVIKKTRKRFLKRLLEVARLIDSDLGKVDVFVYTPKEFQEMVESGNPFVERVLREGKIVYAKEAC